MKVIILLALATITYVKSMDQNKPLSAYGYNRDYTIPLGDKIRAFEEELLKPRIINGSVAAPSQFPYQAGVLTSYDGASGTGICGGSLVSANRVITAAHCWFDGLYQGSQSTIVLGSTTLFYGGTRLTSRNVVVHPQWNPNLIRNDVAVIYLPNSVSFSKTISPIALPSGDQLNENFEGKSAIASGFGRTSDGAGGISTYQVLSYVQLSVIKNSVCAQSYPSNMVDSNICTSGPGDRNTCSGDSGGPLAITISNQTVLAGVVSFGSNLSCQIGLPSVYARVTSFMSFFNQHI